MVRRRAPIDFRLRLAIVPVNYLSGKKGNARAEGNNAAWICECRDAIPLVGRCYFQFDDTCFTVCPSCGRSYRVIGRKSNPAVGRRTTRVDEF
jgi:hypothetical protein